MLQLFSNPVLKNYNGICICLFFEFAEYAQWCQKNVLFVLDGEFHTSIYLDDCYLDAERIDQMRHEIAPDRCLGARKNTFG